MVKYSTDVEAADALAASYKSLKSEISKVVIGQDEVVRQVLTAMFCQGHSLFQGSQRLCWCTLLQPQSI
jgi:MoxR-like ATPase